MPDFDFSKIDEFLNNQSVGFSFEELLNLLISGDYKVIGERVLAQLKRGFLGGISQNAYLIRQMIFILVAFAIYLAIVKAFKDTTLPTIGIYLGYLMLVTLLVTSFQVGYQFVQTVIEKMFSFLTVSLPVFS
ncbi:hypothetical protein P261_02835 [Lachnospiraceae bacterium TWA4]|nr:hypothetical protein P261_02835 [Lachnospiraceae bacterium TWA4]